MAPTTPKFPDYTCCECGTPGDAGNYYGGEAAYADRACFSCHFWLKLVREADNPRHFRAKGHHYTIGDAGMAYPGFSGRAFTVQFADGRVVETSNLWHQGEIPERFRTRLPDNATVTEQPYRRSA